MKYSFQRLQSVRFRVDLNHVCPSLCCKDLSLPFNRAWQKYSSFERSVWNTKYAKSVYKQKSFELKILKS